MWLLRWSFYFLLKRIEIFFSKLILVVNQAKEKKPDVDARICLTRFRGSTTSAKELSAAAKGQLGLSELGSRLGYRVAFSEALGRGMTVVEWGERTARIEMQSLGKEVKRILEGKK